MRGQKASTTLVVVPSTTDAAPSIATVSAPSSHPLYQPYISRSTWTFTQGFVLGQVVFILLLGVFIKYVVFDQGDKDKDGQRKAGSRGEVSIGYESREIPAKDPEEAEGAPIFPPNTASYDNCVVGKSRI
jgi:hypothetical protein